MKSISPELDNHLQQTVTTLAGCWQITRVDGKQYFYTDHDRDLIIDDNRYISAHGFIRTAIANSASTNNSNMDVAGFMDDDSISEEELRNGAFDYSEVEIFYVNWKDLSQGRINLRYGRFGEATWTSSGYFKVELRGIMDLLQQTIGETYAPECRADFGDSRCKIMTQPAVRKVPQRYNEGDIVVVANDPNMSVALPIPNDDFEILAHTSLLGNSQYDGIDRLWTINNVVFYNLDRETLEPTEAYYVLTTGNEPASCNMRILAETAGSGLPSLNSLVRIYSGPTHEIRASVIYVNGDTTVSRSDTPWETREDSEPFNLSVSIGEVPEVFTAIHYRIEARVQTGEDVTPIDIEFTFAPALNGSRLSGTSLEPFNRAIPYTPSARMLGWEGLNAAVVSDNIRMAAASGPHYTRLTTTPTATSAYSRIRFDLADAENIDFDLIDEERARIRVSAVLATEESGNELNFRVECFDEEGALISVLEEEEGFAIRSRRVWGDYHFVADIPVGTRSIRYGVYAVCRNNHTQALTAFDRSSVSVYDKAFEEDTSYLRYGGVEYEAIVAGQTAVLSPDFSRTIGDTVIDGGVTWRVVEPEYTFTKAVGSPESHTQFYIPELDQPNAHMAWGIVRFLEGRNVGKAIEVRNWNNTTKLVTLALPLPFVPEEGDRFVIQKGCDKRRGTCHDRYDNILNFRGEPDVPGTDEFFKVAGVGVSMGGGKKGGIPK